jgi:hypothetical protein
MRKATLRRARITSQFWRHHPMLPVPAHADREWILVRGSAADRAHTRHFAEASIDLIDLSFVAWSVPFKAPVWEIYCTDSQNGSSFSTGVG